MTIASWKVRSRIALMSAPAAKYSSLPAITMQSTSGSASQAATISPSSSSSSTRERVAGVGPVEARDRDRSAPLAEHDVLGAHVIALTPVIARPMISFWICEVPSYSVVTRASRR